MERKGSLYLIQQEPELNVLEWKERLRLQSEEISEIEQFNSFLNHKVTRTKDELKATKKLLPSYIKWYLGDVLRQDPDAVLDPTEFEGYLRGEGGMWQFCRERRQDEIDSARFARTESDMKKHSMRARRFEEIGNFIKKQLKS